MSTDQAIVFAVLGAALVLFVTELLRAEVTAVLVVLALIATGILEPRQAFAGFGSPTIIFLAGLFVLSGGLVKTGVVDMVAHLLQVAVRRRPSRLAAACVMTVCGVSAFVSNTVTVSLFVPLVNRLSRRGGIRPGRVLMPMAYASMLGGVCTVVGTSTNVVVSGEMERLGEAPYSLFETGIVGLPAALLGMVYLLFIAPRLLARRGAQEVSDDYAVRSFLAEVIVGEGSSWVGKSLGTLRPRDRGVEVLGVVRGGGEVEVLGPREPFEPEDVIVVKASPPDLLALASSSGLKTVADDRLVDQAAKDLVFVEVMVASGSTLAGHTLKEARFRQRFGAVALAVYRHGATLHAKVGRVRLHVGDVLLVQGPAAAVEALHDSAQVIALDSRAHHRPERRDRWLALGVFATFLVVGAVTGSFAAAALLGAALMVVSQCITPEEAYAFTGWRVLVVVGGMLSLAEAMVNTDAASWLAHQVLAVAGGSGTVGVLAIFFLLTVLLTQGMSNQAAALVILPVALAAAHEAGLSSRMLAVTITVAASCAFLTPLEPASVLVYGPGRYRFRDFALVGAPLTLIVLVVTLLVVPLAWG